MVKKIIVGVIVTCVGAVLAYFLFRPSPVAFARCSPVQGVAPLDVSCVNESQYSKDHVWDFGDDTGDKVLNKSIDNHKYHNPGKYTIVLSAYGNGKDQWQQDILVDAPVVLPNHQTLVIKATTKEKRLVRVKSYKIDETKDDHPHLFGNDSKRYKKTFKTEKGYKATKTSFLKRSVNHVHDITKNISSDGSIVSFVFRLESGPATNRWRGWLHGDLKVTEEKLIPVEEVVLGKLNVNNYGSYALSTSVPLNTISHIAIFRDENKLIVSGSPEGVLASPANELLFTLRTEKEMIFLDIQKY